MASYSIRNKVIDDWIVPAVAGAAGIVGVAREKPNTYDAPPAVKYNQGRQGHPFAWVYIDPTIPVEGNEIYLSADVLTPIGVAIEVAYRIENQWSDSDIESRGEELAASVYRAVMKRVETDAANLPAGFVDFTILGEPTIEPAPEDGFAVTTLGFQLIVQRSAYDLNQTRAA